MNPVFIDLETRSPVNLKTDGGWKYADHPATELLTVAWSVDGEQAVWLPTVSSCLPSILAAHLPDCRVYTGAQLPNELEQLTERKWVAHNAWGFDELVWNARYPCPIDWIDSYPLANQIGLPGNIDAIGRLLGCGGKEKVGAGRMKKFYDFRKVPGVMDLVLIAKYNLQDVYILEQLYAEWLRCPRQPEWEMEFLRNHRLNNHRGARVDVDFMRELRALSDYAVEQSVEEIARLTGGVFNSLSDLRKRDKVLSWLNDQGINTALELGDSLARQNVSDWIDTLEGDVPPLTALGARVCQLRATAMKITAGKLDAGIAATRNGRINGLLAYWAAHTGRDGGRRIQVQNLPRPSELVDTWGMMEIYEGCGKLPVDLVNSVLIDQLVKVNNKRESEGQKPYSNPASLHDVAGSMLRLAFVGDLAMADFAAIECRGLAWLANEQPLLQLFRDSKCPYSMMAHRIFGRYPASKKDPIRHIGKTVVLGCGYQMGARKFAMYAQQNGADLEANGTSAEACVEAFRTAFPNIAGEIAGEFNGRPYRRGGYWNDTKDAAFSAIHTGKGEVGAIRYRFDGKHLRCYLPSGRYLTYRYARIELKPPPYDPSKLVEVLTYQHIRGYRKDLSPGTLVENNTQAMCRDVMVVAVNRNEADGIPILLRVHDELVADGVVDDEIFHRFMVNMTIPPDWAPDFLLEAEGGRLDRYNKITRPGNPEVSYLNGVKK